MGDPEMNEVESLASEILPASEVDGLDTCMSDKLSSLTEAYLTQTGISHDCEADIIIISDDDDDSDADSSAVVSPIIMLDDDDDDDDSAVDSHDSTVLICTDEEDL
jgi:hypothetical protein